MGLTAHYIDDDCKLYAFTLDSRYLPGSHSGSVLHKGSASMLDTFGRYWVLHSIMLQIMMDLLNFLIMILITLLSSSIIFAVLPMC